MKSWSDKNDHFYFIESCEIHEISGKNSHGRLCSVWRYRSGFWALCCQYTSCNSWSKVRDWKLNFHTREHGNEQGTRHDGKARTISAIFSDLMIIWYRRCLFPQDLVDIRGKICGVCGLICSSLWAYTSTTQTHFWFSKVVASGAGLGNAAIFMHTPGFIGTVVWNLLWGLCLAILRPCSGPSYIILSII